MNKKKKKKIIKGYKPNADTISLNMEEFCNQDPLCPFKSDNEISEDRRKLRKKGSSTCR